MGSDDLFHKRKAKKLNSLIRKSAKKSSYERVLIVCEGRKTEPNYFIGLIRFYKINSANVEVDGASGSSPKSVFERAIYLSEKEYASGNPFDRVYCVFDKDSHVSYESTLSKIQKTKGFFATNSVPCFEYWLLLHFKYTARSYIATQSKSIADVVIKELRRYIPDYTKGAENIFEMLVEKVDFAKVQAVKALTETTSNNTDNPSTYVHELVDYLQNLKNANL